MGGDDDAVRIRRGERHVGQPTAFIAHDTRSGRGLRGRRGAYGATVRDRDRGLATGNRWHERERVDLAVRVRDRRADERTPVLEHEDIGDLRTGKQRDGALGPEIHDPARALNSDGRE